MTRLERLKAAVEAPSTWNLQDLPWLIELVGEARPLVSAMLWQHTPASAHCHCEFCDEGLVPCDTDDADECEPCNARRWLEKVEGRDG